MIRKTARALPPNSDMNVGRTRESGEIHFELSRARDHFLLSRVIRALIFLSFLIGFSGEWISSARFIRVNEQTAQQEKVLRTCSFLLKSVSLSSPSRPSASSKILGLQAGYMGV